MSTMRKTAVVLLAVLLSSTIACRSDHWSTYTSSEGHYSVLLPRQPELRTQQETAGDGSRVDQYLAFATDSSDAAYMVGYFELGHRSYSFDHGRDGAMRRVKGKMIAERDVTLGEHPGREVKFFGEGSNGSQFFFVVRFYQVDNRIFIVQYIAPRSAGSEVPDKAVKYFNSFNVS